MELALDTLGKGTSTFGLSVDALDRLAAPLSR